METPPTRPQSVRIPSLAHGLIFSLRGYVLSRLVEHEQKQETIDVPAAIALFVLRTFTVFDRARIVTIGTVNRGQKISWTDWVWSPFLLTQYLDLERHFPN